MGALAVMGFGNPVRSDDAVGVFVIHELQKRLSGQDQVSFLDMGTGAFEVLFKLQGHSSFWLVDAVVNSGEPDGTLFKLPVDEVQAAIQDDPLVFLHSMKWDQALSYSRKILGDKFPEDITVYLIAISDTKLDIHMSPEIQQAGINLVNTLESQILEKLS